MTSLEDRRRAEVEKYRRVYRDYPNYGNRQNRIDLTMEWVRKFGEAQWLLDVGCGRGEILLAAHKAGLWVMGCDVCVSQVQTPYDGTAVEIDGAHNLFAWTDGEADLVTCTDVLEHILEEDVPAALRELSRVARFATLLVICHRPDTPGKYGPDQLHITVHPREWWLERIAENMEGDVRILYGDRVNDNGSWIEVAK